MLDSTKYYGWKSGIAFWKDMDYKVSDTCSLFMVIRLPIRLITERTNDERMNKGKERRKEWANEWKKGDWMKNKNSDWKT